MISKNEALKQMETTAHGKRVPFSIAFITADRAAWEKKKRLLQELKALKPETEEYRQLEHRINALDVGGRIIEHHDCVLSGSRGMHVKNASTNNESNTNIRTEAAKNPRHWRNRTRNILFRPSQQIRKCHISLITGFNGKEVIY